MSELQIGNGAAWTFLHGAWSDGPEGELLPPDGTEVEYLAVRNEETYGDFTATFRFKFRGAFGGARLLFRLQDSRRFYALDIPWCGQQNRNRHLWAGIVLADGTPLQRYLSFGLVTGLGANFEYWYHVRVEARGPRLRAWIDGRLVADVEDDTYAEGRLGLGGIVVPGTTTPHFGNLAVEGTARAGGPWPGLVAPPPHWITPCTEVDPYAYQSYAGITSTPDGTLIVELAYGNPNAGETRRTVLLKSRDAGRTWGPPEAPTLRGALRLVYVQKDGTWLSIFANDPITKAPLYSYVSQDQGQTWQGPQPLNIEGEWPVGWEGNCGIWPIVRMLDGTLIMPLIMKHTWETKPDHILPNCACFVLRSEDDGGTWSAPIWCDSSNAAPGIPVEPASGPLPAASPYFEVGVAEAEPGVLLGIGRPGKDPYMVQFQSNDAGRTWLPSCSAVFPGYCPSLTRTESGALVATTRFPYFTAHLSRDGGRTWDLPVIVDYAPWANQGAVLAEPETVAVTYMGDINDRGRADSRIARLLVTAEGLVLDH